jgi:hypothetical protein
LANEETVTEVGQGRMFKTSPKRRARNHEYYKKNRDTILAKQKLYVQSRRAETTANQKEWVAGRRESINEYNRKWRKSLRLEILEAYGNKCSCCNELEEAFLEVHHVNGGGNKHRRELGGNAKFYIWLRKNNFPPEFGILCSNCNKAEYKQGICPHRLKKLQEGNVN